MDSFSDNKWEKIISSEPGTLFRQFVVRELVSSQNDSYCSEKIIRSGYLQSTVISQKKTKKNV